MAVVDAQWWGVWWPWMTVWLVTAAGVVTVCAVLVRHVRERGRGSLGRRGVGQRSAYSVCFYLDEKAVMDLYRIGNYSAALEEAVEHRTNVNTSVGLWGRLLPWTVKANRDVTQEKFSSYVAKSEPISVIGMLLDAFERADVIVHADLRTGDVTPNRALAEALGGGADGGGVALSDIEEFVSVRGRFLVEPQPESGAAREIVLRAPYGDDAERPAHVRVTCAPGGLRNERLGSGTFQARCLGKMTGWREDTREVTLEAIAIFR
ncbi:hypothetical protein J8N05_14405 [Streptomyces sp. BH-SS-21]|uniref:Uncharacterized protein n=1 Tax=Streptomyces liliiviolaceus TaxID=2823109 RepID=A0A940XX78_9ACTN|nr:hypothetical protein [Streptomyces liliiviolaceus]MBQ0849397.1 hypothetical protein [Streptomyces liliiviolaceus]